MVPYTLDQSFPGSSVVKNCLPMQETRVQSLGQADPPKEMATHSSILAWEIPWTSLSRLLCLVGYRPWGRKESDTT